MRQSLPMPTRQLLSSRGREGTGRHTRVGGAVLCQDEEGLQVGELRSVIREGGAHGTGILEDNFQA